MLKENGIEEVPESVTTKYLEEGCTIIYIGIDGRAAGMIALADTLRPEAAQMIAQVKSAAVTQSWSRETTIRRQPILRASYP